MTTLQYSGIGRPGEPAEPILIPAFRCTRTVNLKNKWFRGAYDIEYSRKIANYWKGGLWH
jgi:hypothetical protein